MAHNEQVFTPIEIVNGILDNVGYSGPGIRRKHVVDNSCGDGAFLVEVVRRYMGVCAFSNVSREDMASELEAYVHGIEIDQGLCDRTLERLNELCPGVKFDIRRQDALQCEDFNGKMDYVVGNPPYCKVHDLGENHGVVRGFSFAEEGMTDLYLVFFELGIRMMSPSGMLGYITPNSWMTSVAGRKFRDWLRESGKLSRIVQFGGERIFKDATTFTNVTVIDNSRKSDQFQWSTGFNSAFQEGTMHDNIVENALYFAPGRVLDVLRSVMKPDQNKRVLVAKNGFATLNDKFFMCDGLQIGRNVIPCWKASRDEIRPCFYPYDGDGNALEVFNEVDRELSEFMVEKAAELGSPNMSIPRWHLFGRNQGIRDVSKWRIGVCNIISDDPASVKVKLLEPGTGIYAGLYLVNDDGDLVRRLYGVVQHILASDGFREYVRALGKYKNGGYYTFSSRELMNYVNWKLAKIGSD